MKNLIYTLIVFGMLSFISTDVFAQKFGHINTAELLEAHPDIKAADSELEGLQMQFSKTIQGKVETLRAEYADLQSREQEIAPKDLQAEVQKLQEKEVALQQEEQDLQSQLMKKREELYQPILDKINAAIEELAKAEGYTYIFDASQGSLLYSDSTLDLSDKVKATLGLE